MDDELDVRLSTLLERLSRSEWERVGSLTKRELVKLLPGGSIFDALTYGLEETAELEDALALIVSSIREVSERQATEQELRRIYVSISEYLRAFERLFLRQLDASNRIHESVLLLLGRVLPPAEVLSPTVFLISGPSASGKDCLLHSAWASLRARGFQCEYLRKYTTREPRPGEKGSDSGPNYYEYCSSEQYSEYLEAGEIVAEYGKYGNLYGFSRTQLQEYARMRVPTLAIISDFARVPSIIADLRGRDIRVVSILICAPAEDCRRRMLWRHLDHDDEKTRIAEMEADCKYIESHADLVSETYNFTVTNDDNTPFNKASSQLYVWIERCLRTDSGTMHPET